jgi:glycosyltransferase involved in cell wall biosynthesis
VIRVALVDEGEVFGGVEAHLLSIVSELDRGRFEPIVLCRDIPALVEALAARSVAFEVLPRIRHKVDAHYYRRVLAALRATAPHVVHACLGQSYAALLPILAAKRMGAQGVVATFENPTPPADRLQEHARRLSHRRIDVQVIPSRYIEHRLGELGQLQSTRRFIPNGVTPVEMLSREAARDRLGLRPGDFVVGSVGRLVPWKRFDLVIDAAKLVGDAVFVLIGDGPDHDELVDAARGLPVRMAGNVREAARMLKAFDVFVHPTPAEPQGIAVLEAMAAGVPVVGSLTGGVAESISHEVTGLLTEPSGTAIADAIGRLRSDPDLAARLGQAGAEVAASLYSARRMTEHLQAVYQSLARREAFG